MSPYKVKGSAVYVKRGDRWVKKQQSSSPEKAQAAMRLLMAKKHNPDWKTDEENGMMMKRKEMMKRKDMMMK